MGLYAGELAICREVLGKGRSIEEWRGIATILERKGFPKIDPLFGGRYMPAVKAWLDAYNSVDEISFPKRGEGKCSTKLKLRGSSGPPDKPENVYPIGSRDRT
jgi:hypothetical protein